MDRLIGEKVESTKYGIGEIILVYKTEDNKIVTKIKFKNKELDIEIEVLLKSNEYKFNTLESRRKVESLVKGKHENQVPVLKRGTIYGTNAKKIYIDCCNMYGWDISLANKFGFQQKLYAEHAAGEYSVWFIAYSNLNQKKGGKWYNTIYPDRIEEEYKDPTTYCGFKDKRIVFYKTKKDDIDKKEKYIFGGLYIEDEKIEYNSKNNMVITYNRISDTYPIGTDPHPLPPLPQPEPIDLTILIGEKVESKKYGIGEIISVKKTFINKDIEISVTIKYLEKECKLGLITALKNNTLKFVTEEGLKITEEIIEKLKNNN